METIKSFLRDHCHIKFDCIKHQVCCLFMQCRIIDIGNQSDNFKLLSTDRDFISHFDADIVRMHTVDCDLVRFFRESSVKQAGKIHVIIFRINADGSFRFTVIVVIFLLISEEVLINLYRNFCKIRIV